MVKLILIGLKSWIEKQPARFPQYDNITTDTDLQLLLDAFCDQTNIGWDQLICGRLAKSWFTAHDHYFNERHLPPSKQSTIIGPRLVQHLWKFGLSFWYLRNGDIYGTTEDNFREYHKQQLNDRIEAAFDDKDLILDPNDYNLLFSSPKETLLKDNIDAQNNWLLLYETCLSAPFNPIPESSTPKPASQLHRFFRPYQQFYNK